MPHKAGPSSTAMHKFCLDPSESVKFNLTQEIPCAQPVVHMKPDCKAS